MAARSKVYVLDTNALLNDPEVIYAFSGAEVVVPSVVLKELDALKRRRTDRRVRYHGRKATRILFKAAQNGRLLDGVPLENGSLLRVGRSAELEGLPSELDPGSTDDQILGLAWLLSRSPGVQATVVSNDLNMLLRAEALGLDGYRFEGKVGQFTGPRAFSLQWMREHVVTLALGALVLVLAGTTVYFYAGDPGSQDLSDLAIPDDAVTLQALGVSPRLLEDRYREALQGNPEDVGALVNLGNLLFDQARYLEAVGFYRQALDGRPMDANVRTDMGIALLRLGHHREAIEAFRQATEDVPDHALAHYNLGVALTQAGELSEAIEELETALDLAEDEGTVPVAAARALKEEAEGRLDNAASTGDASVEDAGE